MVGSYYIRILFIPFSVRFLLIPLNKHNNIPNIEKTQRESSLFQNNYDSYINSTNIKCKTSTSLESVSCVLQ